jgi:tRNA G18 (ribose-2'-O)-methylase SpoU
MKKETSKKLISKANSDLYLILHDIRSIHNVGSIFRTADCAGVKHIFLSGYTPTPLDRFNRPRKDFAKVSLGAEKSVAWEYEKSVDKIIDKLKAQKVRILALEQDSRSVNYKKAKVTQNAALILGNEVSGISKKILDKSDVIIEIPMLGSKESLNVSVAAGIAIFALI